MNKLFVAFLMMFLCILAYSNAKTMKDTRIKKVCFYRYESPGWKKRVCCDQLQKLGERRWRAVKYIKCSNPPRSKCNRQKKKIKKKIVKKRKVCKTLKKRKVIRKHYSKRVKKIVKTYKKHHKWTYKKVKKYIKVKVPVKVVYHKKIQVTRKVGCWHYHTKQEKKYIHANCSIKRKRRIKYIKTVFSDELNKYVNKTYFKTYWRFRSKNKVLKKEYTRKLVKLWTGRYKHTPNSKDKNCFTKVYKLVWRRVLTKKKKNQYQWCRRRLTKGWHKIWVEKKKWVIENRKRWIRIRKVKVVNHWKTKVVHVRKRVRKVFYRTSYRHKWVTVRKVRHIVRWIPRRVCKIVSKISYKWIYP